MFVIWRPIRLLFALTLVLSCPLLALGAGKTVHVREYTRKDGTVVHAHDRSAPGSGSSSSSSSGSSSNKWDTDDRSSAAPSVSPSTPVEPVQKKPAAPVRRRTAASKPVSNGLLAKSSLPTDAAKPVTPGTKQAFTGKVVGVADGDTITVLDANNVQHKVRLAEIDAPEKAQAFGSRSKEALSGKVFGKTVNVDWSQRDKYGRTIGYVRFGDRSINKEMVSDGMAWQYKQYSTSKALTADEEKAKQSRTGLWADKDPTPPWQFRHPDSAEAK